MDRADLQAYARAARGIRVDCDAALKQSLTAYFGACLDDVRFVVDAGSVLARVRAFALGKTVYVHRDAWQPHTEAGGRLLAHEITHVLQQNPALWRPTSGVVVYPAPAPALEDEACRAAEGFDGDGRFVVRSLLRHPSPQAFNCSTTRNPHDPEGRTYRQMELDSIGNLETAMGQARQVARQTSTERVVCFNSVRGVREQRQQVNFRSFCDHMETRLGSADCTYVHYVFTRAGGLIDLRHFYANMRLGVYEILHVPLVSPGVAEWVGVHVEEGQEIRGWLGSSGAAGSAFSPEDLPSNHHGFQFGRSLIARRLSAVDTVDRFCWQLQCYLERLQPVRRSRLNMDRLVAWYCNPERRDSRARRNWEDLVPDEASGIVIDE